MKQKHLIAAFLFIIFMISMIWLIESSIQEYHYRKQTEQMEDEISANMQDAISENMQEQFDGASPDRAEVLPKFREIYDQNHEFAGWIKIEGTPIDYPVMKPSSDNNYYLDHSPEGTKSKYGAIFLDVNTNLLSEKTNFILYGHYFRDGSMFGSLKNYKVKSFFEMHPYIQFDTIYGEGNYEIIAVFLSKVYKKNQNTFKYYQFTNITSEEEFQLYADQIKALSLYDTGKTAAYGDSLITLSTCDYWTENGRLAVVARKITADQ